MEIIIDWKNISTPEEFYSVFLPQVDAPEWHGHNLNALNDGLVNGDINGLNPPYKITNLNISQTKEAIVDFQSSVFEIFIDSAKEYSGSEIKVK